MLYSFVHVLITRKHHGSVAESPPSQGLLASASPLGLHSFLQVSSGNAFPIATGQQNFWSNAGGMPVVSLPPGSTVDGQQRASEQFAAALSAMTSSRPMATTNPYMWIQPSNGIFNLSPELQAQAQAFQSAVAMSPALQALMSQQANSAAKSDDAITTVSQQLHAIGERELGQTRTDT